MLQGVCGFCAWELDIAFLLRQLHQLAAGRASRVKESVYVEMNTWGSEILKARAG